MGFALLGVERKLVSSFRRFFFPGVIVQWFPMDFRRLFHFWGYFLLVFLVCSVVFSMVFWIHYSLSWIWFGAKTDLTCSSVGVHFPVEDGFEG